MIELLVRIHQDRHYVAIHNVRERVRLWTKVARIVEGNANVRANVEEVAGDETRVWRWVGAASSCE